MLIDVKQISGRSLNQVISILGRPSKIEKFNPSNAPQHYLNEKCFFHSNKIEIVFIEGIADWITIHSPGVPFEVESLEELGLERELPSFKTHYIMRWKALNPFTEITFFSKSDNIVDYIQVKSFQK